MSKILSVIVAHDGRADTLPEVILAAQKIKEITSLELFCFTTELECIKITEKYGLKCNTRVRPEIDRSKISCSYVNHATGMWEGELMHLSYLRNEVLDYVTKSDYDYLFWLDADVVCPPHTVERLLELGGNIASGWYFHKRIPLPAVKFKGQEWKTMDNNFKNKDVVDGLGGGNGGVLVDRDVFSKVRYDLYNGTEAEDTVFFKKATGAGYSMKLDLGLYFNHLGNDWKPKAVQFSKEKAKIWGIDFQI